MAVYYNWPSWGDRSRRTSDYRKKFGICRKFKRQCVDYDRSGHLVSLWIIFEDLPKKILSHFYYFSLHLFGYSRILYTIID